MKLDIDIEQVCVDGIWFLIQTHLFLFVFLLGLEISNSQSQVGNHHYKV